MSIAILDKTGQAYQAPDDAAAQKAVASGEFTLAPASQAAPALPAAPLPQVPATGADVASGVAGGPANELPEPEDPKAAAVAAAVAAHGRNSPEALAAAEQGIPLPEVKPTHLLDENGDLYEAPDEAKAQEAIASGLFKTPTPEELLHAQEQQRETAEVERAGGTGLKPLVGGAVDAALTGAAEHNPVAEIGGALRDPGLQRAEARTVEQVSEAHPAAYGVGAVGGEIGSALAGGELASGLTKAAGLTGVARAAAEGAIYSAEPVAKAIINKDPAASAEALALGVGLNVALHGAFGAIAKLPGAAAEGVEKVQGALRSKFAPQLTQEEAENVIGRKVLGLTSAKIAAAREEIAPALKAAGVTAEDVAEGRALAKVQKLEESGPAIGRAIKALDTFEGKAPVIEEHLANAQAELRKLLPPEVLESEAAAASLKAGKLALKEAASSSERLAARGVISEAESRIEAVGKLSPLAEQASKALQPILDQIDAAAGKGTFEETQALKKFIGGQTNFAADNGFANQLRKRAYGIVAENVGRAEDAAAEGLGSAEAVEGLRQQRGAYALHKLFGDAADRLAARQAPEELTHLLGGPSTGSGHMLPHFVLHAFGLPSGINAALALTGVPQLVKSYVQKQSLRGAAAKLLNESSAPATSTLVHALERQSLELSESVKGFFGSLGTREAEKPLDTTGGLRGFIPDANGRSHSQQLASLQRLVTQAQTDPTAAAARLEHVVAPLRAEGLHEVAQAYTDHQLRLLKVLQAILPKDPDLLAKAHPFAAKVTGDEISPATRARYQRALTVAADPRALLHLVKNNQISQGDVAIAAAVNPSTLQKLRDAVIAEGMKAKPDLNYQQRLSMGILLGQHIDESTEQIPQLQSVYAGASSTPLGPAPHSRSGRLSAGAGKNLTNAPLTLSQQSAGHSR